MALSKAALWVVLAMIALTTIACAAMVLMSQRTGEAYNFLLITFLALILLAPMAVTLHRADYRVGGIVLCAIFLVLWVTFMIQIFQPDFLDRSYRLFTTLEIIFLMGLPTGIGLMCVTKPWGKYFAWMLAGVAAICMPIAILGEWGMEDDRELYRKLTMSGTYLYLYLATGSVLLINFGQGDRRYFRWAGVAAALAASLTGLYAIWGVPAFDDKSWNFATNVLWTSSATMAMINLLLMTWRPGLVRWFQWIAIVLSGLTGAGLIVALWLSFEQYRDLPQELTARFIGTTGTLAAGAIMAMLVARTMLRLNPKPTAPLGIDHIKLHCPICGTLQNVPLQGACHKCLVEFKIALTEPHCPACNYLVLNLTSDHCPECGAAISRPALPEEPAAPAPAAVS